MGKSLMSPPKHLCCPVYGKIVLHYVLLKLKSTKIKDIPFIQPVITPFCVMTKPQVVFVGLGPSYHFANKKTVGAMYMRKKLYITFVRGTVP